MKNTQRGHTVFIHPQGRADSTEPLKSVSVPSKSALAMQKYISFFKSRLFVFSIKWRNRPDWGFFVSTFFKPSVVTFKNLTFILSPREIITHSQLLSLEPVNECYIINRSRAAG